MQPTEVVLGGVKSRQRGADNHLLQQVEQGDAAPAVVRLAAGIDEVPLEVADARGGEVAAVAAREEVE